MKRTFLILIACALALGISAANKKTEYRLRCTAEAQPLTAHVKDWNANRTYRQLVVSTPDGVITPSSISCHPSSIYTLTGRKIQAGAINTLPKGIYIIDGKKTIVK